MHLLILILKKVELTNVIMKELAEVGIKGGTTIDGNGMANAIASMEDLPIFGMLRTILADEEKEVCKVLLFVLEKEQEMATRKTIKSVIGDLNAPNTGIMFSIPITDVEGFGE